MQITLPPWVTILIGLACLAFVLHLIFKLFKRRMLGLPKIIYRLSQKKYRKAVKEAPTLEDAVNLLCADDKVCKDFINLVGKQMESEIESRADSKKGKKP